MIVIRSCICFAYFSLSVSASHGAIEVTGGGVVSFNGVADINLPPGGSLSLRGHFEIASEVVLTVEAGATGTEALILEGEGSSLVSRSFLSSSFRFCSADERGTPPL